MAHPELAAELQAALQRLQPVWLEETAAFLDEADAAAYLEQLRLLLEESHLARHARSGPEAELLQRLTDLLRADLLEHWSANPPGPSHMLEVLRRVESARVALEPRWDQHFAARLNAPSGLEMVVEIAHDLRSPLTSILFLAETMRRTLGAQGDEVHVRQLAIIYTAALGLISMASDVVELARGGERLIDKERTDFSIADLFEAVHDVVRPMAEERGLQIRFSAAVEGLRLGHPVALSRVLLNLTTNALKYTDEGSVEVSARASGGERVEFAVQDTGRGIPPQVLHQLYQPFRRGRAGAGYRFSGSGLGLAICRKLVEALGSGLEVDTEPNRGTRFSFNVVLPRPPR